MTYKQSRNISQGDAKAATRSKRTSVAQAMRGDIDSYERLVNRFQSMAISYAFSILDDFQMAEDAAQDAFAGCFCRPPFRIDVGCLSFALPERAAQLCFEACGYRYEYIPGEEVQKNLPDT